MALSTHAMRPSPYAISPPRLPHMHRSPYNPHFHHPPSANVNPSAFFQTSMLPSSCSFPGTTALPPTSLTNGLTSPMHLSSTSVLQSPTNSHSASSDSPVQPNSPDLEEPLSADPLKHCAYSSLQNGGINGLSSPLSYHGSQSSPLPLACTHPQSMLPSPIYTSQDYGSSIPAGPHCLPSLPIWNTYPTIPTLPPTSFPKLSYDSPRYKLTPERAIPLIKWFEEHKDHPYPTRHEKILLCQSTQLTFTQVSTWFANARRRMKKASSEEAEERSISDDSSSLNGGESPSTSDETCEESTRDH